MKSVMKSVIKKLLDKFYNFKFRNALVFIGIVLSVYLVAGCLLSSIHDERQMQIKTGVTAPAVN